MSSKHILLEPTRYSDGTQNPVQTIPSNGSVVVKIEMCARDIINKSTEQFQIEGPLHQFVKDFSGCIPEGVGRLSFAYVSNVKVTGTINNSPFTFIGGFSDLTRSALNFIDSMQRGAINPEHMKRVNSREPLYNFQIVTTKDIFTEGHVGRQALDDLTDSGDVFDHETEDNYQLATPHAARFSMMVAVYKGVTEETLNNTIFVDPKNANVVRVPANSLIASCLDTTKYKCFYTDDPEKFTREQDLFIVVSAKDVAVIKREILERAQAVKKACMCDLKNITFNIASCVDHSQWRYDPVNDEVIELASQRAIPADTKFTIRLRLNINALFVSVKKTSSALTYNGKAIDFKCVYSINDMDRGRLRKGAKAIYEVKLIKSKDGEIIASTTTTNAEGSTKKRRTQPSEHEEEEEDYDHQTTTSSRDPFGNNDNEISSSYAASSEPVVNDDDD